MPEITAALPWLWPGVAVGFVASILASGPLGRWLGARRTVAWIGLFGLALILASTLTPLPLGFPFPRNAVGTCDLSRVSLAPLSEMLSGGDATLNILLFVPLGLAIGTGPWSTRRVVTALGAFASPFAIEAAQMLVPPLRRGCESADIVDNLAGLTIGLLAGVVVAWLMPAIRRPVAATR